VGFEFLSWTSRHIHKSYKRQPRIDLSVKMPNDTFDEILGLEEKFYDDGYRQGLADGIVAGRIEGRKFGLEKGFEKYVESARLHGKSVIWANRIPQLKDSATKKTQEVQEKKLEQVLAGQSTTFSPLPSLPNNQRLIKHLQVLYALAESDSLSTENTEEAVSDFDDRLKRAQAKAKIVERMVGETQKETGQSGEIAPRGDANIEDASIGKRTD
jgi:hypothetical protein